MYMTPYISSKNAHFNSTYFVLRTIYLPSIRINQQRLRIPDVRRASTPTTSRTFPNQVPMAALPKSSLMLSRMKCSTLIRSLEFESLLFRRGQIWSTKASSLNQVRVLVGLVSLITLTDWMFSNDFNVSRFEPVFGPWFLLNIRCDFKFQARAGLCCATLLKSTKMKPETEQKVTCSHPAPTFWCRLVSKSLYICEY